MKQGKTLVELAQEIESQRSRKQDFVAPTTALTVVATGDKAHPIAIEAENIGRFPMRDLAMTQAAAHTGIPVLYARKMAAEKPDLLAANLNGWFQHAPSRRLVRGLDKQARAFLSDKYQRIDNFDVANVTLEAFHSRKLKIVSTEITESRLYIKAVDESLTREVKSSRVGDMVEAGVMITNSEVGLGSVKLTPYANFTVCTNGLVRDGGKHWNHVGRKIAGEELAYLSDETIKAGDRVDLMVIKDTLSHLFKEETFEAWISKVQGTTEQRITGRVQQSIEVLSEKLVLSQGEGDSILQHLIQGGDLSRYGLMNAVTRTAADALSYDRATEIEALGQRVIDLPANDWREIAEAA